MLPHLSLSLYTHSHIYKDLHIKYLLCSQRVNSLKGRLKRCDATRLSRSVSVSLSVAVAVSVPISVFGRTVRWSLVSSRPSILCCLLCLLLCLFQFRFLLLLLLLLLVVVLCLCFRFVSKSISRAITTCARCVCALLWLLCCCGFFVVSAASYLKPCDCCVLLPTPPCPPLSMPFPLSPSLLPLSFS